MKEEKTKVEFIESYIKIGNSDYKWNDNHGELIRCKDCKHGYHIVNSIKGNITLYRVFCTKPYVERGNATHEPDWFCADGARRQSE